MKKIITSLSVAAISAMASAPTFAGEYLFDGPYLGIEAGYNKMNTHILASLTPPQLATFDSSLSGLTFAGFAGWRVQTDSGLVFGVEASFGDSTSDIVVDTNNKVIFGRQLGIDATIGTTLGEAEEILVFAAIGYKNVKITAQFPAVNYVESANGDGIKFGAGLEYAISKTFSLRGTVNYVNYEADISDTQALLGVLFKF